MSMLSDAEQIAAAAGGIRAQVRRQMRRLVDPHHVASRLFRSADGRLKDDAALWLHELGQQAFADRSTFDPDDRQHAYNQGANALYLEILRSLRLDTRRLAALAQQLRETGDE